MRTLDFWLTEADWEIIEDKFLKINSLLTSLESFPVDEQLPCKQSEIYPSIVDMLVRVDSENPILREILSRLDHALLDKIQYIVDYRLKEIQPIKRTGAKRGENAVLMESESCFITKMKDLLSWRDDDTFEFDRVGLKEFPLPFSSSLWPFVAAEKLQRYK